MQLNLPILSAFSAYFIWGIMPIFWRELQATNPFEIVAHRILWSLLLLTAIVWYRRKSGEVFSISLKDVALTFGSGVFLAVNWGIFVYAIPNGHTLASSFGYFMSPLCMTVAGALLFSEKFAQEKKIALIFLIASLMPLMVGSDLATFLIATGLALSWTGYSSLRKGSTLGSLISLWLETVIMSPLAIAVLAYQYQSPENLAAAQAHWRLLFLTGPVTLIPLLFYGVAVQRVSFSTLGVMHYLVPTLHLFCATIIFEEPMSLAKGSSLTLMLIGVTIVIVPLVFDRRKKVRQ